MIYVDLGKTLSFNYSQIRDVLSLGSNVNQCRQIMIFSGDKIWQQNLSKNIMAGFEESSLWLGTDAPEIFQNIPVNKAHSWLGKEKQVVIFDANSDFDPDSFAAISGIVVGAGFFILLMPEEEKWKEVYSSYFGQRLINSIKSNSAITLVKQNDKEISLTNNDVAKENILTCKKPYLTADQQNAVESIEGQVVRATNNPVILISDRGRGKSATLGIATAKLVKAGIKNIVITAPRLRATDIFFKHLAEQLPDAIVTRGKVILGDCRIQFFSPDQLILEDINADLLMVDEAAGIPVPLLTSLLDKYSQCVFATTVHGYEGTGRGFSLRFNKVLNKQKPGWIKLQMQTPVRWPVNDPLEKWMFNLLCLDAEIVGASLYGKVEINNIEHRLVTKEQLVDNEVLLNEVFALLVLAHYRTRPKDLKSLLDDESLSLYIAFYQQHVIAVAMVMTEGGFTDALSTQVYRGERRPQGHLLAQSLTYHCGIENAATFDYARIMRLAVHPELQQQGIGTALLEYIISNEKTLGRDAIGTSFGMTNDLLNFWKKSKFNIIRVGLTREQTSGEHAAILLLALNDSGTKIFDEAQQRFNNQIPYLISDVLKDLPAEIINNFAHQVDPSENCNIFNKTDLFSFINYSRNYELCIAALNKFVIFKQNEIAERTFPDDFRSILNKKVIDKLSWENIVTELNLTGKNAARKLFHSAIVHLNN